MKFLFPALLLCATLLGGCATTNQRVLDMGDETQLQKRSYQSRIFETADKEKVLRAVISTLQDLGFVIDRADLVLGSISATKQDRNQIRITVSVRSKGNDRMLVRANAQFNISPIEDPKHYQDFFEKVSKSVFLEAQKI